MCIPVVSSLSTVNKLGNEFRLLTNYDLAGRLGGWDQSDDVPRCLCSEQATREHFEQFHIHYSVCTGTPVYYQFLSTLYVHAT